MISLYNAEVMHYIRLMALSTDSPKPPQPHVAKFAHKRVWVLAVCVAIIIAAAVGGTLFLSRDTGPIPRSIRQASTFTLYYPATLPKGYVLQSQSVRGDTGIVFYVLANDKRQVNVSQQPLPPNPPNINSLSGFSKLETTAGKAAIGANGSSPTVIVLSNTTLITINGSPGTPQDVVANIAKNMTSLPE